MGTDASNQSDTEKGSSSNKIRFFPPFLFFTPALQPTFGFSTLLSLLSLHFKSLPWPYDYILPPKAKGCTVKCIMDARTWP